jgi:hypothetical protein
MSDVANLIDRLKHEINSLSPDAAHFLQQWERVMGLVLHLGRPAPANSLRSHWRNRYNDNRSDAHLPSLQQLSDVDTRLTARAVQGRSNPVSNTRDRTVTDVWHRACFPATG